MSEHFFDVFYNRMRIEGRLIARTAVHIGSGDRSGDAAAVLDNEIIRDIYRNPYIPGSSFKGVWRSTAERILAGKWGKEDGGAAICFITDDGSHCLDTNEVKNLKKRCKGEDLANKIYENTCAVCRIFGNAHWASRVKIADLTIDKDTWLGITEVRPGVSIDRDTRTAKDKRKYETEALPAGTEFNLVITAENLTPKTAYNMMLSLKPFVNGDVSIGGSVSRGYGQVQLEITKVYQITKDSLPEYLNEGWAGIEPVSWEEAWQSIAGKDS